MTVESAVYRIRLYEIDGSSRADLAAVLSYFQECFAITCKRHHLTGPEIEKKGLIWVISEIHTRVLGSFPLWSEELRLETLISKKTRTRLSVDFRAYNGDAVCAEGSGTWLMLNRETKRPVKITDYAADLEEDGVPILFEPLLLQADELLPVLEDRFTVSCGDTDYNRHVNNLSYIRWALSYLHSAGIELSAPTEVFVKYEKECFRGEEVHLRLNADARSAVCTVMNGNTKDTACTVSFAHPIS